MNLSENFCLHHYITQHSTQQEHVARTRMRTTTQKMPCVYYIYVICRDLLKDFHGRFISIWNDLNSSFLSSVLLSLCDKLNLLSCTHTEQHSISLSAVHSNKIMFTSQQTMMMHHTHTQHTQHTQHNPGTNGNRLVQINNSNA